MTTVSKAAKILEEQLIRVVGEQAMGEVQPVFKKRGISIPARVGSGKENVQDSRA
jgi:hypothetical protein